MTKTSKGHKVVTVKKTRVEGRAKKHSKGCMHCVIMQAVVNHVEDGSDPMDVFEALGQVAGDIIGQQPDPAAGALMVGHMMLAASAQYFGHLSRGTLRELPRQLMDLLQAQVEAPPKSKMN